MSALLPPVSGAFPFFAVSHGVTRFLGPAGFGVFLKFLGLGFVVV